MKKKKSIEERVADKLVKEQEKREEFNKKKLNLNKLRGIFEGSHNKN